MTHLAKHIIVVGGGYAGTEFLRQLLMRGVRNVEIELISNKTHFENTIGGVEIISGKEKTENLTYDLSILADYWGFQLTVGSAEDIDLRNKTARVRGREKAYDILVLATGSEPNFFNVKGTELTNTAYHLSDFANLGARLREIAANCPKVVIAGGGFVGFEAAAETVDLFKASKKELQLTIIEKMSTVLPAYPNQAARKTAQENLASKGVRFMLGNGIRAVQRDRLILQNDFAVESDLTIWTAGVKGCLASSKIPGAALHDGCIEVDDRLMVQGKENAFAIGDNAHVSIGGKEASKMAAEALEQAKTAAKNVTLIAKGQKPSVSHVPKYTTDFPQALLSLGEGKALLILGSEVMSLGYTEYFLKKRLDFQEIMDRFPQ